MIAKHITGLLTILFFLSACAEKTSANLAELQGIQDQTALLCSDCHNQLVDSTGVDVSYYDLWVGSMHANASLDPYYLSSIRHEAEIHPDHKTGLESDCAVCHLPVAHMDARQFELSTDFLTSGAATPDNPLHSEYRDAVSCLGCHQILAGKRESDVRMNGTFQTRPVASNGMRLILGPYEISDENQTIMQDSARVTVDQSGYMGTSQYCAVCHTLFTATVYQNGRKEGANFPEQVPYLEWQQSIYAETTNCQHCHVPVTPGEAKISTMSESTQNPVHLHGFSGANQYMLQLMKDHADTFGLQKVDHQLGAGVNRDIAFLQQQTANLSIDWRNEKDLLTVTVQVDNFAGHKLPTAYPSRRIWLHVVVLDKDGVVIFESGGYKPDGSIIGNSNDEDASRYEPHYEKIENPDQVQIYEAIILDESGSVTTSLLSANSYVKDNRIPPPGFDKTTANPDTAVHGDASSDANFIDGSDQLSYAIQLSSTREPVLIRVELLYQSIGYRWLKNLGASENESVSKFLEQALANPNIPVVLAVEEMIIP